MLFVIRVRAEDVGSRLQLREAPLGRLDLCFGRSGGALEVPGVGWGDKGFSLGLRVRGSGI